MLIIFKIIISTSPTTSPSVHTLYRALYLSLPTR
jgi:hypothetical protein